ncbi:MAG: hypothetical protein KKB59_14120 [Spirochaetes bacterium]|nr:hypothetical protein [Spirochaetota bacterium]
MAGLSFGGTGVGASIGTAILPGIGTAIGAGLGLLFDFVNWGSAQANEDAADALSAKSDALSYHTAALETSVAIEQANSNISAYESFLSAFPNYAELTKNSYEAQSRNEFRGLLNNYAMGNVAAGASGRVGGSAGLLTAEAQSELVDYAGADMELGGGDGGRYEMARTELYGNLTAEEEQARSQLEVLRSSLSMLDETLELYTTAEADAQERVDAYETSEAEKAARREAAAARREELAASRSERGE